MNKNPQHIAIIMDGNGRWARARNLPRTAGHQKGIDACKRIVRAAGEMEIKYLTLFGFSTENWSRPPEEIDELMRLLRMYLRSETADLHQNNVRMKMIGDRSAFSRETVELIENAENLTRQNDGLQLTIALNYGGRDEIIRAASTAAAFLTTMNKPLSQENFEEYFEEFLMTKNIPDPDIMIRTSGEQRISNFLLWQCAYTEFAFVDTQWPDFDRHHLEQVIKDYTKRERRFGAVETA
ncbi:MAG: isoprenyl transferase [Pseudomonadota bacterium]